MTKTKVLGAAIIAMGALFLCSLPMAAADSPHAILQHPTYFAAGHVTQSYQPETFGLHQANPVRHIPKPYITPTPDPVVQHQVTPSSEFNPVYNVLGVGVGFPNYSVPDAPPDTTLAVGDTEVVQWVNVSYADFNKSTGAVIPLNGQDSTLGNTVWANLLPGTQCANNNDGDIIVKFDRQAHRWILAQNVFGEPYAVCIAVSQTNTFSDNLWYAYQFGVVDNGFPDYPKWGVWATGGPSDGYYQNWNNFGPGGDGFQGPAMCGYDRQKMLAGDAGAEQICFQLDATEDSLLPADLDSPITPPATEDEFFIGSVGDIDNSHLSLYSMHINDWATGSATMTGLNNSQPIQVATYVPSCDGQYGGDCVPQPTVGSGNDVDSLGDRLMYRFAYWSDQAQNHATATPPLPAPLQHWFVNFDVWNSGTSSIGVRWMEFIANLRTVPVTSLSIFQQGTYAPDSTYRWMGSLTRDNVRDILVGFSKSSTSIYPSIAVAGREYTDPLGTLSPEVVVANGSGSQEDTANRWGDYSTMAIDPSDNCTFFYTTEYYTITSTFSWSTNVSAWKFPGCQ
ncbi:MAG TPA: hypothetical protein VMD98_01215 [Bryocella sp.]|nr:hypothetical protein [Bryocella sp.]